MIKILSLTIFLSQMCLYAGCVVKQQNFSSKLKNRLKKLVQNQHLVDNLPFGAIEKLAKAHNKDRGTVRGVLQGKWVNLEILCGAINIIKKDIEAKQKFLESFEDEFLELKEAIE